MALGWQGNRITIPCDFADFFSLRFQNTAFVMIFYRRLHEKDYLNG